MTEKTALTYQWLVGVLGAAVLGMGTITYKSAERIYAGLDARIERVEKRIETDIKAISGRVLQVERTQIDLVKAKNILGKIESQLEIHAIELAEDRVRNRAFFEMLEATLEKPVTSED